MRQQARLATRCRVSTTDSIYKLFIALLLTQLAGCGVINAVTERPFRGDEQAIQIGSTTRSEVQYLLGAPYDQDPMGNWEVYRTRTDGVRFALVVPYSKSKIWTHYLLVTYDAKERVNGVGAGEDETDTVNHSFGKGPTLYAGDYGYHTFTRQAFPSIDGGGEADSAWAIYLRAVRHHLNAHDKNAFFSADASAYQDVGFALSFLCTAAEREHPCAFKELGDFFWRRPNGFARDHNNECRSEARSFRLRQAGDDVKACVWYAMFNRKVVPRWCREALSSDEISRVKGLLVHWQPSKCEQELAPYICGSDLCR